MNDKMIKFLKAKGFKEHKTISGSVDYRLRVKTYGEVCVSENGIVVFHFYECFADLLRVEQIADLLDYYKRKLDEIELGE